MKRTMGIVVSMALVAAMAGSAVAGSVKKNAPKKKAVEAELKAIGGEHFPDRMKVREIGPIRAGDTYFHAFSGQLKKVGYHVIIYDNDLHYLGFYATEFEPSDYEEGAVLLDSGDGENFYNIPIGPKGPDPKKKIRMPEGLPLTFVPAPGQENAAAGGGVVAAPKVKGKDGLTAEYRDWTITRKGKTFKVRAIYVSQTFGKVKIKAEANGKIAEIKLPELSKDDQAYVKKFK